MNLFVVVDEMLRLMESDVKFYNQVMDGSEFRKFFFAWLFRRSNR